MRRLQFLAAVCSIAVLFISCSKSEKGAVTGSTSEAPSFIVTDISHKRIRLADYRGKVVLLEFFASWCPPCRISAPDLRAVYEKYRDKGLVVLSISIDEGPGALSAVDSFMKEFGLPFPAVLDDGEISGQYGIVSIPTSIIIDKQGAIRNRHIGMIPDMKETLSREIEALL
ncbi:MAG: TlpA family protein disulfide reductase [Alphaproteobacteria bacterium]|uniref:TlpA family protein disulfide reductase n=1 Tax=Candidatus Nitrobium versatile TaxID=2884831 RepID=A0A953J512_9BACT|nr:TlpA family protein disulfide reductase [Candidatus Nitrobium versatile]